MIEHLSQQSPDDDSNSEPTLLRQPNVVPLSDGVRWITQGFQFFRQSSLEWISTTVVGFFVIIAMLLIPTIGQLAFNLLAYVWSAGLLIGCHEQAKSKPMKVSYLFAGFSSPKLRQLILLSVILFLYSSVIIIVIIGSDPDYLAAAEAGPEALQNYLLQNPELQKKLASIMLLLIPMIVITWFAPALMSLNNLSLFEAMKLSFKGYISNILPFIVYKSLLFILLTIAVIPFFLGLLIFLPIFFASIYVSYRAIFLSESHIYEA